VRAPARSAVAVLYSGFFLCGIVTVLLGPLIPELAATWGVDHGELSSLFLAQFVASSVGAVLSTFHLRRGLVGGYALMALGLLTLTIGSWPLAPVAVALIGCGTGLAIPATNLWTAHTFTARRGAALALLNLFWGLGAVACPLLFAALLGRFPAATLLGILAGLTALTALTAATLSATALAVGTRTPREERGEKPARGGDGAAVGAPGVGLGVLILLASMLFLYIGVENAIGGWLVSLADQLGEERSAVSLLIGSGFWGALLTGRGLASWLLGRMAEPVLYTASLGVAVAGTLVLLGADSRAGIAAGAVVAGLGLAALFPLTVSLLAARTAASGSRSTGWLFAVGGLGGAALPWATGRIAAGAGAFSRGFLIPLAGLALLATLFVLDRLGGRGGEGPVGGRPA